MARLAVVVQPEQSRTVHTKQHGSRKRSAASSASEQKESSGLEHWEILPLGVLYPCTLQRRTQAGRRTSRIVSLR